MNYRHSFHAGNFADIVKHALVLWLLERRQTSGPVTVIDTHAGAGLYDLTGDAARSKEAEAGVARLMASADRPPTVEALAREVARLNPHGSAKVAYRDAQWNVILAPVVRMEARGLTREMLGPRQPVTLVGYPRKDGTREMRIERVIAGDRTVELR